MKLYFLLLLIVIVVNGCKPRNSCKVEINPDGDKYVFIHWGDTLNEGFNISRFEQLIDARNDALKVGKNDMKDEIIQKIFNDALKFRTKGNQFKSEKSLDSMRTYEYFIAEIIDIDTTFKTKP